ncbi:MAG: type II toxin-antitoxin system death-on-curing family toxin [Christensenella sp.]
MLSTTAKSNALAVCRDAAKAARLGYEMITQHPFADANKRTAAVLIIAYMRLCGYKFKPRSEDFYEIIYGVAEGSFGFEDILHFVENSL